MDGNAGCYGKKVFHTYWEASRNAKGLKRQFNGAKANVYRCDRCRQYHVGNSLGKKEKHYGSRKQITDNYRSMVEKEGLFRDGHSATGRDSDWDSGYSSFD